VEILGMRTDVAHVYGVAVECLVWQRADLADEVTRRLPMAPDQAAPVSGG
jgi:hypothetical protein